VEERLHLQEDFKGHGIGLAPVQRVIHCPGGRIWAQADPEQGTIS
jgi:light-regulated signal transduction histidine kinase (bacteriophytochrome)